MTLTPLKFYYLLPIKRQFSTLFFCKKEKKNTILRKEINK